jgi:hypothetical protein
MLTKREGNMTQRQYDELISIPEVRRPEGSRVYYADNKDSDWRNGLIALVVFAIASAFVYLASGSIKLAVTLYIFLALFTVLAVMGVINTLWALTLEFLAEWKWANVELEKVRATKDVLLSRSREILERQEQDHTLEMAKLSKDKTIHALQEDVAYLLTQTNKKHEHNYVNNKPLVMQNNVQVWLRAQYDEKGEAQVGSTAKGKMPWNAEWSGQPWKELARDMLTKGDDSPLVTVWNEGTKKPSHYTLRYGTSAEALRSVGFS